MMDKGQTILVTGGAGFIGSNFVAHILTQWKNVRVINLDKLTYAGSMDNLSDALDNPNHIFVEADICDPKLVENLFKEYTIGSVIHFAAESHVDNSITGPGAFITTNINGTFNLLEAARNFWNDDDPRIHRFHQISTDEVYGSLGPDGHFTETSPYAPNSPYSASKASADFLVRSYNHTYGLNTVVSNCSNNYGPHQHQEKLIPTIIRKALAHQPIPIYGDGKNVRDWLYVEDHCRALTTIFEKGNAGETYAIGANEEWNNLALAEKICGLLDQMHPWEKPYGSLIQFVTDRPGHDYRYAIDATKTRTLGWEPQETLETGLEKTLAFYLQQNTQRV